jgi:hypothetical protein
VRHRCSPASPRASVPPKPTASLTRDNASRCWWMIDGLNHVPGTPCSRVPPPHEGSNGPSCGCAGHTVRRRAAGGARLRHLPTSHRCTTLPTVPPLLLIDCARHSFVALLHPGAMPWDPRTSHPAPAKRNNGARARRWVSDLKTVVVPPSRSTRSTVREQVRVPARHKATQSLHRPHQVVHLLHRRTVHGATAINAPC